MNKLGVLAVTVMGSFLVAGAASMRADRSKDFTAPAVEPVAAEPLKPGPTLGGCPVFPPDNVWNTPVDKLGLDPHSDDYIAAIGAEKPVHPSFGSDPENGIPITLIGAHAAPVKVEFEYRDQSDLGNYPIPSVAKIEAGDDHHILLVDRDRCMLYELFAATKKPDGSWTAGSGIKMDLTSNAQREEGKTSADAAGLAILPGLVRYDEVSAGEIRHALRFTATKTQNTYIWPATHAASRSSDAKLPPMGVRFRLKAAVDISGYSKENQVILRALKRYGMILADNGSAWFVVGEPDQRWSDGDLHRLGQIKGSDFEAVDESDFQMLKDSGRVDPISTR